MTRFPAKLVGEWSAILFKYSWWVIGFYTALAIAGWFYTSQTLGVNSDTSEMFDHELPFRTTRDQLKQSFPAIEDNFVVVVSGTVPELVGSISDSITIQLQQQSVFESIHQPTRNDFIKRNGLLFMDTATLNQLSEKVIRSRPMMSFLTNNYSLKGLFSFLGLTMRFSSKEKLENMNPLLGKMDQVLEATLQGQPTLMSWQNLMGAEVDSIHYEFIQIKPLLDYSRFRPVKPAITKTREIIDQFQGKEVNIRITGKKAMTYEEMGSVIDGALQASILALLMVSVVLWIGLRSLRLIAATLLALLVGLILTATFSAWAIGHLNMISIAFAVLYIGLGVDYAIHLCLRYRELRQSEKNNRDSITLSIEDVGPALWLSTLSTSIGFYAFVPTDFAGVSELGIIAGTGMFISLIITLTLLPCLIWRLGNLSDKPIPKRRPLLSFSLQKRHSTIRIITVLLAVVAIWLLSKASFDYDPINLRNPDSESVKTLRELMTINSFNPWTLEVLVKDSTELVEVSTRLKKVPEVGRVIHLFSFIPGNQELKRTTIDSTRSLFGQVSKFPSGLGNEPLDNQLKAIEVFKAMLQSPLFHDSPNITSFGEHLTQLSELDNQELTATIEVFERNLLAALPLAINDLQAGLHPGAPSYRTIPQYIKERWQSADGSLRIQVFPENRIDTNYEMKRFASAVQQVAPLATGDLAVTIASGETVVSAFKQAIFTALVAIFLLLIVYLKNIRLTLYVLLPLLLAGAFTGAATVLFDIDFNFANIIALPLLLGLGVDNGVHMVHRARSLHSTGSLLQTSTARAILFSSLTTLLSFGNLAFSPHRGTASMGWILTIGVTFIIVTTLVILPAFLPGNQEGDKSNQEA